MTQRGDFESVEAPRWTRLAMDDQGREVRLEATAAHEQVVAARCRIETEAPVGGLRT